MLGCLTPKRTGLKGIFLRQFSTFGAARRCNVDVSNSVLDFYGIPLDEGKWYASRFVTVGYYALVDFLQTVPQPDGKNEIVEWIDHNAVPELVLDHKEILDKALVAKPTIKRLNKNISVTLKSSVTS